MTIARRSPQSPQTSHGDDGLNNSLGFADPSTMYRLFATESIAPAGVNWGRFSDKRFDELCAQSQRTFDKAEQVRLLAQSHEIIVDQAAFLFICHDQNPRALSPRVKGFQPAQSWTQDFTQVTVV